MTTNKSAIIEDILTALATITVANGYRSTIPAGSVFDEIKAYDELATDSLPALCAFAGRETRPATYYPFADIEKLLPITVIGHVHALTSSLRRAAISDLEQDVLDALTVDPTRGGWAVDTIQETGPLTDEGEKEIGGKRGETNSMVLKFLVTYFPND